MTRDDILRMAREAGFEQQMRHRDGGVTVLPDALFVRFAARVRAAALEEAAKAADQRSAYWWRIYKGLALHDGKSMRADQHVQGMSDGADDASEAIRALLTKEPSNESPR